jgi:hypothetical protein
MYEQTRPEREPRSTESAPARPAPGGRPSPASVAALQRQAGNRATGAMLQRFGLRDVRVPILGSAIGGVSGFLGSAWIWRPWFLQRANDARGRPIFSAEWDAWGHCVCGALAAAWGTDFEAWLVGEGRETVQDLFGQDSHAMDSHNQAVGRSIGTEHGYETVEQLAPLCLDAYLSGRLRIGPNREAAWLPWCGPHDLTEHLTSMEIFHATERREGHLWFPASAPNAQGLSQDPSQWVEAVDCGSRGTRMGGHLAHPSAPVVVP